MNLAWYVAIGGAVGSVTRYALSLAIQQRASTPMPVGTLVINVTGSLLLGFLLRYASGSAAVSPEMRALLATGFFGGYTTFSTFSYETIALIDAGDTRRAALYIVLSVGLSLGGAMLGFLAARALLAARHGI